MSTQALKALKAKRAAIKAQYTRTRNAIDARSTRSGRYVRKAAKEEIRRTLESIQ